MAPSVTVFVSPTKAPFLASIIEKLQKHFPIYIDAVNYHPIVRKSR